MENVNDSDVTNVLLEDGVDVVDLVSFVNRPAVNVGDVACKLGDGAWAARVVYNDRFGGVLIRQMPGDSNRLHYHPESDECWVIMEGTLKWFIEGHGTQIVTAGDIILVPAGTRHMILCVGTEPATRFAITKPDVNHVYSDEEIDDA